MDKGPDSQPRAGHLVWGAASEPAGEGAKTREMYSSGTIRIVFDIYTSARLLIMDRSPLPSLRVMVVEIRIMGGWCFLYFFPGKGDTHSNTAGYEE